MVPPIPPSKNSPETSQAMGEASLFHHVPWGPPPLQSLTVGMNQNVIAHNTYEDMAVLFLIISLGDRKRSLQILFPFGAPVSFFFIVSFAVSRFFGVYLSIAYSSLFSPFRASQTDSHLAPMLCVRTCLIALCLHRKQPPTLFIDPNPLARPLLTKILAHSFKIRQEARCLLFSHLFLVRVFGV